MYIVSPVFQETWRIKLQDAWNLNANCTHGYVYISKNLKRKAIPKEGPDT